jgi:hypothetical protein
MSLPYGQRAKELLQELKRSEWLPNYNVSAQRQAARWRAQMLNCSRCC